MGTLGSLPPRPNVLADAEFSAQMPSTGVVAGPRAHLLDVGHVPALADGRDIRRVDGRSPAIRAARADYDFELRRKSGRPVVRPEVTHLFETVRALSLRGCSLGLPNGVWLDSC